MEEMINPSLRISTMTLISQLDSEIILEELYNKLSINDTIKYIEYADKKPKGEKTKKVKKRKKKELIDSLKNAGKSKKRKYFYNQVTIHIMIDKIINVKIFNNGSLQMTGLKRFDQSDKILEILVDLFYKNQIISSTTILSKNIVMINSDFHIGFEINREKLHRLICDKKYYSSFEPIIYPGVNIKYYYNPSNIEDGICKCDGLCNGKGLNGHCKRITVAVFNSGNIIITGGRSIHQINTAYDFISKTINDNKNILEEKEIKCKEIE